MAQTFFINEVKFQSLRRFSEGSSATAAVKWGSISLFQSLRRFSEGSSPTGHRGRRESRDVSIAEAIL